MTSLPGGLQHVDDDQVTSVLGFRQAYEVVREAFVGQATMRPEAGLMHLDHGVGEYHVKSGFAGSRHFACKVNAAYPDDQGRRTVRGVLVVFDAEVGSPRAVVASRRLTRVRTAATTVLAVQTLGVESPASVTIVGAGTQAVAHVDAFVELAAVGSFRLVGRSPAKLRAAIDSIRSRHPDVEVEGATESSALRFAEIIVTCTNSREPIVHLADVASARVVAGVGADSPGKWELATDVLAAAAVVTDLTSQCVRVGDLQHAVRAGVMTSDDVFAELGDVLSGKASAIDATSLRVYDSTGTGFQDAAAAGFVCDALLP